MPLNIKNPEADQLARELSALTGESITDAVIAAMRERLERERARRGYARVSQEMLRIRERYSGCRCRTPDPPSTLSATTTRGCRVSRVSWSSTRRR